ncbi:7119_t:CDS:2, partial [Scutellospora calospora]
MQTTDIEKIVLNSGVSQAVNDKKLLENTEKTLIQVAHGQKPVITYARFSIKKFDQKGNYNLGLDDLNIFPTVPYDLTFKNQGVQITIVFKSSSAEENGKEEENEVINNLLARKKYWERKRDFYH